MIRNVQSLAPRAATTNRALALDCLTLGSNNIMCRYHQTKAKRVAPIDGEYSGKVEGQYRVTGVPYMRALNEKETKSGQGTKALDKKATKSGNGTVHPQGYLNCGCSEEAVLFEFFFWKTWTITSLTTSVMEGFMDQLMDPRTRLFFVTAYKAATGLTLDDLYSNGLNAHDHKVALLTKQIAVFTKQLDDLKAMDKEDVDMEDLLPVK
jgi:hypothetical protein